MKRNAQRFFLTALIAATGVFLSAAFGQSVALEARRGAPQDWSHKHLLFPNPDTRDEAARKGQFAFAQWQEKLKDPRFASQVAKKTRFLKAKEGNPFSPEELQWARRFNRNPPPAGPAVERDWSVALGTGGYGKPGVFPAKFSFNINATPDCTNDFVVFPTTGTGTNASASGSFTSSATAGQTVTITNPNTGQSITLTASATLNTGLNFKTGNASASATNLAAAIVRNGASVGVTEAGATRPTVTVTALDPGVGGNSITLAETLTNFSWGSATLTTGTDPPTTRPTIVAFNGLYKTTCSATPPATYWSFNTGAAFTETSPVLSLSGDQVAFVQRGGSSGTSSLVLLKWSSGSGTVASPTVLTTQTAGNYRACANPCMLVIPFGNSAPATNSSPFYDYSNDILYVGDNIGRLHKFTGIFNGTPAEAGSPWPVTVSAGNTLTSPVYDYTSGLIFVGSASGTSTGGSLHSINSSGTVVTSGRLATNNSAGVRDAPIVDSSAGQVYAFVGSDVNASGTNCNTAPCASVYQFTTAFTGGGTGTKFYVGRGVTSTTAGFLYAGTFDNTYFTSSNSASPTGSLYVCGSLAATAQRPTLWKIPITSNVMGTPVVGPSLVGSGSSSCSAITEVMNGANEYVFASVTANGNDTGCTGACIYSYKLTGLTWNTSAVATAGLAATGGTSGIIVDNISSTTGASQVYYSTLTNPGNAIQASQAALN